jgi:MOSC domain-containing protein YiiM
MKIRHIFISPGHNFFGHQGLPPGEHPVEEVESAKCVAGRGLVGDRFYGYRDNYKGQVTLFAFETLEALRREFGRPDVPPDVVRRNIVVEGADLNALIGKRFELQGVALEGIEECRPCHWMNGAVAPGAEDWLRGRGGLRCRVVTSGTFRRDA